MADKTIKGLGCLDDLFNQARRFRKSGEARALFEFTAGFPKLAPLNALLVHIQQPGSRMVATANDWFLKYGRKLKFNAKPLIILWPFGPVEFVYDIGDTEPTADAKEIPKELLQPFQPTGTLDFNILHQLQSNLPAIGVQTFYEDMGIVMGGAISPIRGRYYQRIDGQWVKLLYEIKLRRKSDPGSTFAILIHELGHLFCGHLNKLNGSRVDKRFPLREELRGKEKDELKVILEFEAESVAWLVCRRLGLENPADVYLATYWQDDDQELPDISLNAIFWAAGKIEALCKNIQPPQKEVILDRENPEARGYKEWGYE